MNASIDREHFKTLTHAIASLGRTSEYIAVQGTRIDDGSHKLRLSALNKGQTAFVAFTCYEEFFDSITIPGQRFDITLNAKALLSVLRHQNTKQIHSCELELVGESDDKREAESRFVIRFYSSKNFMRSFRLTYESKPALFPRDAKSDVNRICIKAKSLQELLDHFPTSSFSSAVTQGEVSMECASDYCMIKSRIEDHIDKSRCLETNVMVEPTAFDLYDIGDRQSKVQFGLKDFKNAIMLADTLKYSMYLSFHRGGQPIIIEIRVQDQGMHQPVAVAQFTIATSEPDEASNEEIAQHQERRQEALDNQRRREREAQKQRQERHEVTREEEEQSSVLEGPAAAGRHHGPVRSTMMAAGEESAATAASSSRNVADAPTATNNGEKPLFREDASSSQGSVMPGDGASPPLLPKGVEKEDTFDHDFEDNDADLQMMEDLEVRIQRGEVVPRGSQGSQMPPEGSQGRTERGEGEELAGANLLDVQGAPSEVEGTTIATTTASSSNSLSQQRRALARVDFASPLQEVSESSRAAAAPQDDNNEESSEEQNEEAETEAELQDYDEGVRIAKRRREMVLGEDSLLNDSVTSGDENEEEELGATDDEGEGQKEAQQEEEQEDLIPGTNPENEKSGNSNAQSFEPLFPLS